MLLYLKRLVLRTIVCSLLGAVIGVIWGQWANSASSIYDRATPVHRMAPIYPPLW